jgi:hypothetical protein
MIWIQIAQNFKFFSNDGSTREYRLGLQSFGLKVKNVVYAIQVLDRSSSNAKIGIRHDQGATDNLNIMEQADTPIALATPSLLSTLKGQVGESTSDILLPFFMPVVLAGTESGEQSVTANIFVGGTLYGG